MPNIDRKFLRNILLSRSFHLRFGFHIGRSRIIRLLLFWGGRLEREKENSSPSQYCLWPLILLGIPVFALTYLSLRTATPTRSEPELEQDNPKTKMRNEILKVEIVSVAPRLPQNDDPNGGKKGSPFWRKIAEICIPVGTIGLLLVNIPLSCYTKKSADAAYNGIELARKNARMDQRAWVAISDIPPPNFQKNSNWSVSLILKNTGKTPAKNFVIRATGDAVGKGQKPSAQEITLPGHGIIAPDGVFHSNLNISGRYDWKSSDLVIHGTIDYDSVFGCSHWTKFCYYFVPNESGKGGGFAPCDSGNDIDNNPP